MKTFPMLVIALGLLGGCKKDKKDDGAGATGSGDVKKTPPGTDGDGSASASGSGSASASGTGMASGTDTGSDTGSGSGTASGTATDVAPTPDGAGVKVVLAPPAVGSEATKNEHRISDVTITSKGQQIPMHVEEIKIEHVKYLEVTDFPQKLEVSYEDDHKTTSAQGKEKTEASPVSGKTYTVWKDGGKITATHADGSAIQPDELEELTKAFDDEIGQVPGVATVLASRGWTAGEVYTLTPDDIALMSAGREGGKILSATLVLESESGGNAVFAMETKNELDDDKVVGKLDAKVTVTVQLSPARPLTITTEGKIDATAGGNPFAGTMNSTETYTY